MNGMRTFDIHRPLEDFFANSSIALALAHADGDNHLALVSDRFCQLTGYEASEVVGRNCRFLQEDGGGRVANNEEAKLKLHAFLEAPDIANVRTPIVNFRKNGEAFVNLLFMSKLKSNTGEVRFIFASQFDVSRSQPDLLSQYDRDLDGSLGRLKPLLDEHNVIMEGTLATIANSTTTIAQAKLTLAELEQASEY